MREASVELMAAISRLRRVTRNDDAITVCNALESMLAERNASMTQKETFQQRRRGGRKLKGDRPMTATERVAAHRARRKANMATSHTLRGE
jgi:hypothetical protein